MAKWTKQYTDIANVNHGNQFQNGDHVTKEALNTALNNTASNKEAIDTNATNLTTKVDKEPNKGLVYQLISPNLDLNTIVVSGFYYCQYGWTNGPSDIPNTNYINLIVNGGQSSDYAGGLTQIVIGVDSQRAYIRTRANNTWSPWLRTDVQPSLYNLGAYDTIKFNDDGTATITRQTGYAKGLKELEQQLNATFQLDGVGSNWSVRLSISTSIINTNFGIKSIYKLDNDAYGYTGPDEIVTFIDTGNNKFSVYGKGNYDTRDKLFSVVFNFQYKLATSYTEKVILNQPLLNLPQEGTQWLREEWEKGLNLFSASVTYDLTAGSEQWKLFQLENLVVGQTYTIYSYDTNDIYYQLMIAYNDFKTKPVTFTATSTRLEARVGKNNLTSNVSGTVKVILVKGKALPQTFYEYYGPLIRQSTLRNQVPMLGADGKNKVMLGCRGSGHNPNGSGVKYIYLGRWENTEINDNDSGIHIKGIIGGWLSPIQAIIDVVASWREGWTFSGSINQKVPYMDIVITDAYKVYLMISDTDTYYNYNIDIECGTNGVVTYTGELLTSVDGNIMARMNEKVYVTLTDEFTSFGRSIDTLKLYSNTNPEWWKNGVKQGQLALTSDINAEIGNKLAKLKDNYLNDNGQVNALGVIDNAMSELTPFYLEAYTNQADFNNDIYQAIKGSVKPKLTSISFDANVASSIFEVIDFDYDAGDTAFYFGIGSIGSKVKDIVTFPVGNPSSIASVDIETSGDTGYISYMVRSIDVTGAISLDAVAVKNVYGLKYYSTPSNATEKTMYINIKITDIYGNVFRTGQITVRFKSNQ